MRTAPKLALSLAVFAGAASALEVGLRVAGYAPAEPPPPLALDPAVSGGADAGDLAFRFDAACLWSPRPGAALVPPLCASDTGEVVNAAGFRGPALALERTPGRLRVATLGDSSTFGYGVAYEDAYPARLAARLDARGIEAEVLDAGVVGHTALLGVERYRRDVRPYRPDVVVVAFGAVNEGIPVPFDDAERLARARRGPVARLAGRSRVVALAAELGRSRDRRQGSGEPAALHELPDDAVPRLSLEAFDAALDELARLVREDSAELVVVSMPRRPRTERDLPSLVAYSERVEAFARRVEAPLVDARRIFREADDGRSLLLDRVHPSPAGHERIARALEEALVADGVASAAWSTGPSGRSARAVAEDEP